MGRACRRTDIRVSETAHPATPRVVAALRTRSVRGGGDWHGRQALDWSRVRVCAFARPGAPGDDRRVDRGEMSALGRSVFADRYRVLGRLGAGGTATVFLAQDERLRREVAVKRLHGAEVAAQTGQRLRREARIMAALRHPNLVTVYDMPMDEDDLLLVMEYVPGESLGAVLAYAPFGWKR